MASIAKRQASLGPKRGHNKLFAAGGSHDLHEFGVLPRVNRCSIVRRDLSYSQSKAVVESSDRFANRSEKTSPVSVVEISLDARMCGA